MPRQTPVLVLPVRDYRMDPAMLFREGPGTTDAREVEFWSTEVARILSRQPEVRVLTIDDGLDRGGRRAETLAMVRGLLRLGQERYRDLHVAEAIPILRQGIESAQRSYMDLWNPEEVSELHLVLGLCLLEAGDPAAAHAAFREMFRVTPTRVFAAGWYPATVEAAIRGAAQDFLRARMMDLPLGGVDRLEDLLHLSRATAVVALSLRRPEGSEVPVVSLRILERPPGPGASLSLVVREDLPWDTTAMAQERLSRSLGAWLACLALPSRRAEEPRLPAVFLDTTGTWSAYMKPGPLRRRFHNAGFGLGLSWQVLEGLDVFGVLQVTNSFQDPFGDLLRDFWTVRLSAGVGYSVRFRWGRVYLHTGLLFDYLSDFVATTEVRCKFWPDRPDLCPASRVQQPRWMLGWMAAPGVEVRMVGPLQLVIRVGVGAHFVAKDLAGALNFPVQVEIGLGYAFPVGKRDLR